MKKLKKKPAENLIKSVLDDLKDDAEPSIQNEEESPKPSAIGQAVFGQYDYNTASKTRQAPQGATSVMPSKDIDKTTLLGAHQQEGSDDKTTVLGSENKNEAPAQPIKDEFSQIRDKTYVVPKSGDARATPSSSQSAPSEVKVSFGSAKPSFKGSSFDAQFAQAENLKFAQSRIIELEKDVERLRKENEMLISANEIAKQKLDDFLSRIQTLEKSRGELKEQNESELRIFKDGLVSKDSEIHRLRTKVEELESRLASDLKKIRVRERELENRLELSKLEKTALVRSKDENILELKRKIDYMTSEVENYQNKVIELNQKIESSNEQFGRTVRALRLALTNLEVNEHTGSITLAPYKKAE